MCTCFYTPMAMGMRERAMVELTKKLMNKPEELHVRVKAKETVKEEIPPVSNKKDTIKML